MSQKDWHRAPCQAGQMHRAQSSLWSKRLEADGWAKRAEVVCPAAPWKDDT